MTGAFDYDIPAHLWLEMVTMSVRVHREEVCGFVLQRMNGGLYLLRCRNVAANVRISFCIDPMMQRAIQVDRTKNIIGTFHSHPTGNSVASSHDIASFQVCPEDWVHVIIGLKEEPHINAYRVDKSRVIPLSTHVVF